MAIIKKFAPFQNLSNFQVFERDKEPTSKYFRLSQLNETLTGGKNAFLIEGSTFLKESTEIKIEILDVNGNPVYFEPGDGVPEYYEGTSKLISIHVYDDTPIGLGKITILGELKEYEDDAGGLVEVPDEWKGIYNVAWERDILINNLLPNETNVRFYKRPIVNITELVKPIFSKSVPNVTDTGFVHGVPQVPSEGSDLSIWRAGTTYKLIKTSGSWDRDVDENVITITNPTFSSRIIEVLNDTEVLVETPHTVDGLVSGFTSGSYSVTFADFQNQILGETSLTGSFAKIDITQLKTFAGDVARLKVFRKSRNEVGDFQFVQEAKLESSELLRDITTTQDTELSYGRFDEYNLSNYWVSSSNDHTLSIDSSLLSQAVKVDYDENVGGVQRLITSESISVSSDVEYTLSFKTLLDGNFGTDKSIKAFFSSSNFTQDFLTISGSSVFKTKQDISQNIISQNTGDAKLVFEITGDWYLSNVSLKNAQETSFSPDEFTIIQDIPRKTASETFDFKFEFYDINNNFIPVDVTAVGVFDGGNDFPNNAKLLTFESDRNAFRFSSGSFQNPENQQIQLKVSKVNLTGSVLFASSAFDVDGNFLNPSDYTQYPGKLTNINPAGALITINNFTGSRTDGSETPFVGSIVYTASLENQQEFETVYRLEDGDNAPQLIVTSNANQFIYEPTTLSPKPSSQSITIRAQRKNLASLITPIEVNSGSNRPELNYVSTIGGIDTFTLSATEFSQSFSQNNFDEVTYSFTGSDVFGNLQSDEITLSKVINFDAVSLVLTNESTTFQAKSTGEVLGGFEASSGSVQVYIGSSEITHDDYDSDSSRNRNTFDIKSITGTNVTPTDTSPNTSNYSISAFQNNKDSGSLTLDIEYLAGDNSTSQSFQKIVSYTKAKKATPNVLTKTTPSTQTINSGSTGFETPQTVEVIVQEGGTEYAYQSSLSGGESEAQKFEILSVHSGSNSNEIITVESGTFPAYNGTIGSASIQYVDSEGTLVQNKTVRFDVSVSKVGQDGLNARSVSLSFSDNSISYNADEGNPDPATITLIASSSNFESPVFKFTGGGSDFTDETTFSAGNDGDNDTATFTAPTSYSSTPYTFKVEVQEAGNSSISATDTETAVSIKPGLDIRPRFIIKPLNGTQIKNATGNLELQVVRLDGTGSFDISGSAQGDAQLHSGSNLLTTSMPGISDGGNGVTYNAVFAPSSIIGTKEILLKETDGTVLDSINLLDVTDGLGGGSFLTTTGLVTHREPNNSNAFTPTTLAATASFFDVDGTEYQKAVTITPGFSGGDNMKVSTASGASNISITANDGDGNSMTLGDSNSTDTKDVVLVATFTDTNGNTNTITETFFIVSEGQDGSNAKTIRLSADALTFVEAKDGTITPNTITFTANRQNTDDTTTTFSSSPSVTLGGSGADVRTLTKGNFGTNSSVTITATADSAEVSDEVTIVRLVEGSDGITVSNSNPAHTLPASAVGVVSSYANSGTALRVFEGATELDFVFTGATAGQYTISTSQSPSSSPALITLGTVSDETNGLSVGNHSSMDDNTDSILITYNIVGKRLNGDSFTTTTTQTITKSKEGFDAIAVAIDNSTHSFPASAAGVVSSYSNSGTTIEVFEGTTALTFTTNANPGDGEYKVTVTDTNITAGSVSGNGTSVFTIGNHSAFDNASTNAEIDYAISGNRTGGTGFSASAKQTFVKSNAGSDGSPGADAVSIIPSITSQNIGRTISTNPNTFDSVQNISFTVTQGSTTLTAIPAGGTISNNQYRVSTSGLVNCTEGADGVISPTQPSTSTFTDGGTCEFTIQYRVDGTTHDVDFTHVITVTPEGQTGPGIVHTGVWEDGRVYQYGIGATGRRDSVLWESTTVGQYDTYYAAKRQHTSDEADTDVDGDGKPNVATDTWENLGTQDLFVAAKIGIFEDSFIQNTLNVGSNNSGGTSSSNITIFGGTDAGGSTNPYISIGQSGTVGSQGFGVNGIFMGMHSNTAKFSVQNGTQFMKWDGTDLNISGDITVTNPNDFAAPTFSYNFGGDGTQVLDTGVWNKNGGVDETPSTTGIGFDDNSSGTSWNSAVVSKRNFKRSNGPRLEWDFKILQVASDTDNRYEMLGWGASSTMTSHTSQVYAIYVQDQYIFWRFHNSSGTADFAVDDPPGISVGDTFRLRITLKTGGGALGELFKNGDFTSPVSTYDWGSTGTETELYVATTHRDSGTPKLEHQSVQVGLPSGVGTKISGNTIATGQIQSNNFSTTAGSELDLDAGTIKLGGSSDPNFSVTSAGHVTAKGGGSIAGWDISDTQLASSDLTGGDDGEFTSEGILINSTDGGYISAQQFSIDSDGNARFGGVVSGSSIIGGSINIGDGNFTVDSTGFMSASNASIGGTIETEDATLGGWIVDADAITSDGGNVILHATDEYITVSDTDGIPRATLSTEDSLPSPSSGGTNINRSVSMSRQTEDVGPPSGFGNIITDSGTLTQTITSFSPSISGAHSFTYTYTGTGVNVSFATATGMGSSATLSITVKIYSDSSYSTQVGSIGSWSVNAFGYDSEGGFNSVIGNTKILLSNGFIKKAKDITKNDKLLVWDYKTNQYVESKIKSINKRIVNEIYKVTLDNGTVIQVSDTHGFWLDNNEQIFVNKLVEGQSKIYVKDGNDIKLDFVKKVEIIQTDKEVFTFRIPKFENYISDGVISHNPPDSFPETQTNSLSAPQTRSRTINLDSTLTYYPRIEGRYDIQATGLGSNDSTRQAQIGFDLHGSLSVNSISAGTTINAAGLQTNSNDSKVFRLDTSAEDYDPFALLLGGLEVDGFKHKYTPMDLGTATDSSFDTSNFDQAHLDLGTFSFAAGRAACTILFNESTSAATLQDSTNSDYACVNVDGVSITNINTNHTQRIRINFITGHNAYKWTPLVNTVGRTTHSGGDPATGLYDQESINNYAALIGGASSADTYCDISVRDNDGNGVRVPDILNLVCLG